MSPTSPKTLSREHAVKFLYQCEREKIFYFNEVSIRDYVENFEVPTNSLEYMETILKGVFADLSLIDRHIENFSKNWSINRMSSTDRCILRVSVYEVLNSQTPKKVVLNEAIELAKTFGTENSGRFVNGLLDKIVNSLAS